VINFRKCRIPSKQLFAMRTPRLAVATSMVTSDRVPAILPSMCQVEAGFQGSGKASRVCTNSQAKRWQYRRARFVRRSMTCWRTIDMPSCWRLTDSRAMAHPRNIRLRMFTRFGTDAWRAASNSPAIPLLFTMLGDPLRHSRPLRRAGTRSVNEERRTNREAAWSQSRADR
jgi:hypothetical protein